MKQSWYYLLVSEDAVSGTCFETFDSKRKEITSPNFPNDYNKEENCSWIINSPANTTIKLSFLVFDLEEDEFCAYDYFEIINGITSDTNSTVEKLCGLIDRCEERFIYSRDGGIALNFLSDINIVHKGFHIKFEIIGQEKGI